ncbi:hypothetical protein VTN02DRAFT_6633 [Thermoascus thermophilus]
MDPYSAILLQWLQGMAADANLRPAKRMKASYIVTSFHTHRNTIRLMAQVSALSRGALEIPACHLIAPATELPQNAVNRHGQLLQAIVADFGIIPTLADFEGHPIELISILPPDIEDVLDGDKRLELHKTILHMERVANAKLNECTDKYGYHYIFRAGIRQYYMTKAVVEHVNFLRPDPRGEEYRAFAQNLCYEAIEKYPCLNSTEKRMIILAIRCFPQDALGFCV